MSGFVFSARHPNIPWQIFPLGGGKWRTSPLIYMQDKPRHRSIMHIARSHNPKSIEQRRGRSNKTIGQGQESQTLSMWIHFQALCHFSLLRMVRRTSPVYQIQSARLNFLYLGARVSPVVGSSRASSNSIDDIIYYKIEHVFCPRDQLCNHLDVTGSLLANGIWQK